MKKRILSIFLCLFLLVSLTACGGGVTYEPAQKGFDKDVISNAPLADEIIATNDKYTLQYDAETGAVNLIETDTENIWEVCPTPKKEPELNEFGLPMSRDDFTQSAIQIGFQNSSKGIETGENVVKVTSFNDALLLGKVTYTPIEKDGRRVGVTVAYYFTEQEIMVPVDYVLEKDYVRISINTKNIQEGESNRLTSVSLAPFLNAVENDTPDSYLFMPSGSGALINTKTNTDIGYAYSSYVYGEDIAMDEQYYAGNETPVRMPVYGYKSGELGGFSIIEKGSDAAVINVTSGSKTYGFSTVYPSFNLRGFTNYITRSFNQTYSNAIFPNNMIDCELSVRFYPLKGENANYTGMANIYRNYLVNECGLAKTDEEKAINIDIIGGAEITKSFLGVPYKTVYDTTNLNEATDIISKLNSNNIKDMSVKLKGFGTSGVDIGEVGGGYTIDGNLGSKADAKAFVDFCAEKGIDTYMDYELVKFSSNGSGFSTSSDAVMNSGYITAIQYIFDRAIRNNEKDLKYYLLRPVRFGDAVDKSLKANAKWNFGGISFDTLSSLTYSDYSDYNETVLYNSRQGYADAVTGALSKVKENNQKLLASSANIYTALRANIVTEAPIDSLNGYAFTESVPFYTMVLKGYVPMTTESINRATTPKKAFLGAVESGIGLNYTVIKKWDNSLVNSDYTYFFSTKYDGVENQIITEYNDYSKYFDSVKGAKIVSNTIVSEGVHCTVFDNNVTVYVNYNDKAVETPAGKIAAMNYIVTTGGAVNE